MKGTSPFIQHSLILLIGTVMIILLISSVMIFYNNLTISNTRAALKQVAVQTANSIIHLYNLAQESDVQPKNSSSVVLSTLDLDYPEKVNGRNYEVLLVSSPGIWNFIINLTIEGKNTTIIKEETSSSKIIARTTQEPFVSYEHDLTNVPILIEGSYRSGGNATLRLVRFNYNGTIEDVILLGDVDLIVKVLSIK